LLAVCMMLMFAQFAFATVVSPEGTGPQTGGSTGGSSTGAPMLAIAAIGSAMVGAGYLLSRRSAK
jgi:hypothetical protein